MNDPAHDRLFLTTRRRTFTFTVRWPWLRRRRPSRVPDSMIPAIWAAAMVKNHSLRLSGWDGTPEGLRLRPEDLDTVKINRIGPVQP